MEVKECKNCGTKDQLQAKWNSKEGVGWIHCDGCGNVSKPVALNLGREKIIQQWNSEQ